MNPSDPVIIDSLSSLETEPSQPVIYDRKIGMRLLYEDPTSGAEHYLIRYPAGLKAKRHRHTAAQTIIVLQGLLVVDDQLIGPGGYCHFPPGRPMFHGPADNESCVFVSIFDRPSDVEPLE